MKQTIVGRRTFLKVGGAAAAGLSVAVNEAFGMSTRGRIRMADLTKAHFEPHVGETFTIQLDDGARLSAKLVSAEGKTQGGIESFSLLFEAPRRPELPQGIRPVSHPDVGTHDIFLVPVGADDASVSYEAVFTRMVK